MAMGKEVGRLAIRILPDATRFRNDLQLLVKRVEQSMSVNLKVQADTREAEVTLIKFRNAESRKGINVAATVSTAIARTQLTALGRDRFVQFHVRMNESSLTKANAILARMSGFRVATNILRDVSDALKNIDLNVPKIARVSLAIASLSAVTLVASAGLVTLTGDLAKMGNTGLILPAMLSGLATGVITLAMALKDSKTQLGVLGPAFTRLQDSISAEFWAKAQKPIIEFVNSVLPQARTGFAITAEALGNQAAAIAGAFQKTFANGVLLGMFEKLRDTMNIVTTGAQGFAEAVTTLGVVGSAYLPRLAEWVVKIGDGFNSWLQDAAVSGRLDAYIEDGITQMKLFGSSVSDMIGILRGIDSAATAAGGTGLTAFAENMAGASAIINSPAVQTALTTILTGATQAMDGLGRGMEKVGDMFVALAPQLQGVLALSGDAVGGLVGAMADAMNQPLFKGGLMDLFTGLRNAADSLEPAMGPLFGFLGQLGSVLGALAGQIGPLLAAIKITFAPVLEEMLAAVEPLIPMLGGLLVGAVASLAPLMEQLARFIADNSTAVGIAVLAIGGLALAMKVGGAASLAMSTAIGIVKAVQLGYTAATYGSTAATYAAGAASKAGAIAHGIMAAATAVVSGSLYAQVAAWVAQTGAIIASKAQAVLLGAAWVANIIGQGVKVVASLALQTGAFIANTAAQVAQKAVILGGAAAMGIATAATWLWNAALAANPITLVVIAIAALVAGLVWFFTQTELGQQVWANFTQFLTEAWTNISTVATDIWNGIVTFFTETWTNITTFLTEAWANIAAVAVIVFTGIGQFFSDTWNNIVAWISAAAQFILDLFLTWNPLGIIIANWGGIVTFFTELWNGVVAFISQAITNVMIVIATIGALIAAGWNATWSGIGSFVSGIWNGIIAFVSQAIANVQAVITFVGNVIRGVWSGIWTGITTIVSNAWNGITGFVGKIVTGIQNLIGTIGSTLAGIPATVKNAFSAAGTWLLDAGKSIVQGLIDGINNMISGAKKAAEGVMTAISNFFPHSPAKEGPFSGRGWTLYSGEAMGEGLAEGMSNTVGKVRDSARAMMSAASGVARIGVDEAFAGVTAGSGSATGDTINVNGNVGYDPKELADAIALKKWQAAMRIGVNMVMPA